MTANIWNEAKTVKELTRQVAYVLPELGWFLTTAESCTGGNLASALCAEEDTASFFSTGVVTFSDEAKHKVLGVSNATLDKYSAVSKQTVSEMAEGALALADADVSIAISGYAGPDGGDDGTPVGTVWFAWGFRGEVNTAVQHFSGECEDVIEKAVRYALSELLRRIPHWKKRLH